MPTYIHVHIHMRAEYAAFVMAPAINNDAKNSRRVHDCTCIAATRISRKMKGKKTDALLVWKIRIAVRYFSTYIHEKEERIRSDWPTASIYLPAMRPVRLCLVQIFLRSRRAAVLRCSPRSTPVRQIYVHVQHNIRITGYVCRES